MRVLKVICFLICSVSMSISAQEKGETQKYKVKKGESLKDVADKFQVSYTTLLRANKGIARQPKKGTIVSVPANPFKKTKRPVDIQTKPDLNNLTFQLPKKKDSLAIHKVMPKETLYSLSKQYKISMSTLIKVNPILAQEGLKIGQELKVPANNNKHNVAPKETLYSISKNTEFL